MSKLENILVDAQNKVKDAERELRKWQLIYDERVSQKIAIEIIIGNDKIK